VGDSRCTTARSLLARVGARRVRGLVGLSGDVRLRLRTGRIRLHESSSRTPEAVVTDLYEKVFGTDPDLTSDREGSPGER